MSYRKPVWAVLFALSAFGGVQPYNAIAHAIGGRMQPMVSLPGTEWDFRGTITGNVNGNSITNIDATLVALLNASPPTGYRPFEMSVETDVDPQNYARTMIGPLRFATNLGFYQQGANTATAAYCSAPRLTFCVQADPNVATLSNNLFDYGTSPLLVGPIIIDGGQVNITFDLSTAPYKVSAAIDLTGSKSLVFGISPAEYKATFTGQCTNCLSSSPSPMPSSPTSIPPTSTPMNTPTGTPTTTPTGTPMDTPTGTPTITPTGTPTTTATNTPVLPTNTSIPPTSAPTSTPASLAPSAATTTPSPPRVTDPTATATATQSVPSAGAGTPLTLASLPPRVTTGSILIIHLTTLPWHAVTVTLEVTERRTVTTGSGKKRHRLVRVVTLYQIVTHDTTDARGRLDTRLHVTFRAKKSYQASLTVTMKGTHGIVKATTYLRIIPSQTHTRR